MHTNQFSFVTQVLSNPNAEEVLAEVRRFALIFVGIGVFSGIGNFIQVRTIYSFTQV